MRSTLIGAFLVAAATACQSAPQPAQPGGATALSPPPPTTTGPVSNDGLVARGEYVAAIGGCASCHGADLGGGEQHASGAMGSWRGPNITPDPQLGIGAWNDDQLAAAIRDGVRPDGRELAPLMPYPAYHALTDDDTEALVAYLQSRPAVHRQIDRGHLDMPPVAVPAAREQLTRGAYLATVMHCSACHGKDYAGGMKMQEGGDTVIAPNITSDHDHGIGEWSDRDVERAVRGMVAKNGHVIHKPMADYRDSWSKLSDDDARALAGFVRGIPAVAKPVPTE
jgi:mono/diheme cytochrome c family protein|nr:c-type cytochrome [Kofleriaceae bacterium]